MVDLQLLGPVCLRHAGEPVPLPTLKVQALLLLLAQGGAQPRSRLAAWLWPRLDDRSARRNLRRELARLREIGLADVVLAEGEHLVLTDAVRLDTRLAAQAAEAGRPDEALGHWRGSLGDGLELDAADEFADWLASQRQRLQAQWRQWQASACAAREAAGDLLGALEHLHRLLQDDPLQEQLHRQAMRLHAAAGQREAALAQHRHCEDLLRRELGLSPSAETEALAAELRGAGPVAAPADADARPLPAELPLVGRDAEWAQMAAAWAEGRAIVLEGEAGIGKTRLARDFAASRGAFALAQCRRSDTGVPYASFTRVLRRLAGDSLAQAGLPTWVQLELAHVLPELGVGPQRIGSPEEQRRFCEACATAWQGLAAGSFDTVIVDDWHLADDASRALLGFIADQRQQRGGGATREIFVLRPELGEQAQAQQQALQEAGGALHLRLAPLGPAPVYQLVQRLSRAADPRRFAQRLERATGGNPFFVGETLRQWLALKLLSVGPDGVWQTPFDDATQDYAELAVPDSVRDTVLARVQRQSDAVRRLLEAAALASEPFGPVLLAGACALSELEALDAIEQAVAAQLLREREGGYAFAHDLVQQALDSALPGERRRLVHRRLALGAEAAGLPAADIARHWEAGGQPERAVRHRMAAAESALALYADADAQAHWDAALADGPTLAQKIRILGQRWPLMAHRGDGPGLIRLVAELDRARAEAQAQTQAIAGSEALALEANVQAAEILAQGQRNEEALDRIQASLADPALPAGLRAQALRVQSQALSRLGRTDEACAANEAALAAGGLTPLQQGDLLHALSYAHFLRGDAPASLEHARRALAIWQAAGARRQAAQAQASIGRALDMLDEREAAWAALEKAYAQASELRMIDLQRVVANNLANNRLHHGGPARAVEVIGEARALSPHFTMPAMPVFYLDILSQAHAQLGALGTALDTAEQALDGALALGETLSIADCLGMTLELHSRLGHRAGWERLMQAFAGRSLAGLRYFEVKNGFTLAAHAVRRGRLDDARAQLAVVGDVDTLPQPPDRAAGRLCHALLALAAGEPEAALAWLAPLAGADLYTEVQLNGCAVRLAAQLRRGRIDDEALALADAALASASPGHTLPALPWLGLRQVRRRAAQARGDTAAEQRLAVEIAAQQAALAASLGRHAGLAAALQDQMPVG
jgi:DNA-binding SARP family transcriptional activator